LYLSCVFDLAIKLHKTLMQAYEVRDINAVNLQSRGINPTLNNFFAQIVKPRFNTFEVFTATLSLETLSDKNAIST